MTEAARALFTTELGPALQRFVKPLYQIAARLERSRVQWLTHAATAAVASAATWELAVYLGVR